MDDQEPIEVIAARLNKGVLPWISKREVLRLATELSKDKDERLAQCTKESYANVRQLLDAYKSIMIESFKLSCCIAFCGSHMSACKCPCSKRTEIINTFNNYYNSLSNDNISELLGEKDKETWERINKL